MTSREFIQRYFGVNDGRSRECSSVFKDGEGNIYSYGAHYPLLFTVGGRAIRNVRGYSVTTAKHIGWCYDMGALDIVVPEGWRIGDDLSRLVAGQRDHVQRLFDIVSSKKRTDTMAYKDAFKSWARAEENLKILESIA